MKLHYYPGCTLKQKTTALDISTREAMKRLDVELVEPEGWTCCGAEYPLTEEKIVGLAAPIRVLRQVREEGGDVVVTTCSFCYAVLKRANKAIQDDPLKHKRINAYLRDDIQIDPLTKERTTGFEDYNGEVKVLHLLEYLRDRVGYPRIRERLKRDLKGLAVAPYYGCRVLRPQEEMAVDEPDSPQDFRGIPRSRRVRGRRLPLQAGMLRLLSLRLPARRGHGSLLPHPPLGADERGQGRRRDLPAVLLQHGPSPGGHQGGLPGFLRAARSCSSPRSWPGRWAWTNPFSASGSTASPRTACSARLRRPR